MHNGVNGQALRKRVGDDSMATLPLSELTVAAKRSAVSGSKLLVASSKIITLGFFEEEDRNRSAGRIQPRFPSFFEVEFHCEIHCNSSATENGRQFDPPADRWRARQESDHVRLFLLRFSLA